MLKFEAWNDKIDEQLIYGKECIVELPLCSKLVQTTGDTPVYLVLTFEGGYYYFKTVDDGDLCQTILITDDTALVKKNVLLIAVVEDSVNE